MNTISLVSSAQVNPLKIGRVIFLKENHLDVEERKKNINYLLKHYKYERGDVALIEDDSSLPTDKLNLAQIGSLQHRQCRILGWDEHTSCVQRKMAKAYLQTISLACTALVEANFSKDTELHIGLLSDLAKRVQIPEWSSLPAEPLDIFKNPSLANYKTNLIAAINDYVKKAFSYITFQHFERRQIALKNKIIDCLQRYKGKIFVMVGENHINHLNSKVSASVCMLTTAISQAQNLPLAL